MESWKHIKNFLVNKKEKSLALFFVFEKNETQNTQIFELSNYQIFYGKFKKAKLKFRYG